VKSLEGKLNPFQPWKYRAGSNTLRAPPLVMPRTEVNDVRRSADPAED